jgi:hypothetical protein
MIKNLLPKLITAYFIMFIMILLAASSSASEGVDAGFTPANPNPIQVTTVPLIQNLSLFSVSGVNRTFEEVMPRTNLFPQQDYNFTFNISDAAPLSQLSRITVKMFYSTDREFDKDMVFGSGAFGVNVTNVTDGSGLNFVWQWRTENASSGIVYASGLDSGLSSWSRDLSGLIGTNSGTETIDFDVELPIQPSKIAKFAGRNWHIAVLVEKNEDYTNAGFSILSDFGMNWYGEILLDSPNAFVWPNPITGSGGDPVLNPQNTVRFGTSFGDSELNKTELMVRYISNGNYEKTIQSSGNTWVSDASNPLANGNPFTATLVGRDPSAPQEMAIRFNESGINDLTQSLRFLTDQSTLIREKSLFTSSPETGDEYFYNLFVSLAPEFQNGTYRGVINLGLRDPFYVILNVENDELYAGTPFARLGQTFSTVQEAADKAVVDATSGQTIRLLRDLNANLFIPMGATAGFSSPSFNVGQLNYEVFNNASSTPISTSAFNTLLSNATVFASGVVDAVHTDVFSKPNGNLPTPLNQAVPNDEKNVLNWSSVTQLETILGVNGIGPENFALRLTGFFVPQETGTYTFTIEGDDAVDLTISGIVVASQYGGNSLKALGTNTGTINLVAGVAVSFQVRHQEGSSDEALRVFWRRPSQSGGDTNWYQYKNELAASNLAYTQNRSNLTLDFDSFSVDGNVVIQGLGSIDSTLTMSGFGSILQDLTIDGRNLQVISNAEVFGTTYVYNTSMSSYIISEQQHGEIIVGNNNQGRARIVSLNERVQPRVTINTIERIFLEGEFDLVTFIQNSTAFDFDGHARFESATVKEIIVNENSELYFDSGSSVTSGFTTANGKTARVYLESGVLPNELGSGTFDVTEFNQQNVINVTTSVVYATLQAAIDAATNGQTLRVREYVNAETITIPDNKSITIEGIQRDYLAFERYSTLDKAPRFRNRGESVLTHAMTIESDEVTINGLKFDFATSQSLSVNADALTLTNTWVSKSHTMSGVEAAIRLESVSGLLITDSAFTDIANINGNRLGNPSSNNRHGLLFSGVTQNIIIRDNHFREIDGKNIGFTGASLTNLTIDNNNHNRSVYGIELIDAVVAIEVDHFSSGLIRGLTITNPYISPIQILTSVANAVVQNIEIRNVIVDGLNFNTSLYFKNTASNALLENINIINNIMAPVTDKHNIYFENNGVGATYQNIQLDLNRIDTAPNGTSAIVNSH